MSDLSDRLAALRVGFQQMTVGRLEPDNETVTYDPTMQNLQSVGIQLVEVMQQLDQKLTDLGARLHAAGF